MPIYTDTGLIVLGRGNTIDGPTPETLQNGIDAAELLIHQSRIDTVFTLGGGPPGEITDFDTTEADAMAGLIENKGLERPLKIYREGRSRDTIQNIVNFRELVEDEGIELERYLVLGAGIMHARRATLIGRRIMPEAEFTPISSTVRPGLTKDLAEIAQSALYWAVTIGSDPETVDDKRHPLYRAPAGFAKKVLAGTKIASNVTQKS